MKTLRRFLFYIFIFLYIVICPLIILYALGIIFSPKAEKLVKTGLICLASTPQATAVYMNGDIFSEKTPAIIRELPVGAYTVKLTCEEYRPFEKTVNVAAEKATVLDQILLIPDKWEKKQVDEKPFTQLIPLKETPFFLLSRGPLAKDLFVIKPGGIFNRPPQVKTAAPVKPSPIASLVSENAPYADAKIVKIFSSPESSALLIQAQKNKKNYFLWITLEGQNIELNDISEFFRDPPEQIQWEDDENLFMLNNGVISSIALSQKAIFPQVAQDVRSYAILNKKIYALMKNQTLKEIHAKDNTRTTDIIPPVFIKNFFGEQGLITFSVFRENIFLFAGPKGELFTNQPPYNLVPEGIIGFLPTADPKQFFIWSKTGIGLLTFSEKNADEDLFGQGAMVTWLITDGKNIKQIFSVYDDAYILYLDQDTVYLIETETSGPAIKTEVIQIKNASAVSYAETTGKLYYLDPVTSLLTSINIVPSHPMLPAFFPKADKNPQGAEPVKKE